MLRRWWEEASCAGLLVFRTMSGLPEEFAKRYAEMSEVELMELAQDYDSLTEVAKAALRAEFARRNLEPPLVEDAEEAEQPLGRELVTLRR